MKNYYKILEVDKGASDEVIKVAYKSLVKKYHPDLNTGTEQSIAEEKIKEINEAYDILSDPVQREEYDKTIATKKISADELNSIINENIKLKQEINRDQNNNYFTFDNSLKKIIIVLIIFFILFIMLKIPFFTNLLAILFNENIILIVIVFILFYFFRHRN